MVDEFLESSEIQWVTSHFSKKTEAPFPRHRRKSGQEATKPGAFLGFVGYSQMVKHGNIYGDIYGEIVRI